MTLRVPAVLLSVAVVLTTGLIVAPAAQAAPKAKSYKNCTALNKVYPHGVGRSGARDHTSSSKRVTNFKVSTKVYNLNNGPRQGAQYDLDRDNDGIACEKA